MGLENSNALYNRYWHGNNQNLFYFNSNWKMISEIGKELDNVELETIKTTPILELLLELKSVLLLALQLVNLLSVFFSAERKAKVKALIVRLKEAQA